MISDSHDPESRSGRDKTADGPNTQAICVHLRSSAVHNFQPVSETTKTVRTRDVLVLVNIRHIRATDMFVTTSGGTGTITGLS